MEHSAEFNLEFALNHYLDSLNSNRVLSKEDKDELFDHMCSEMEALRKVGLTHEEAFLISKKRLGQAELINQEYQKAKPWANISQFFLFGILFLFGIKAILNLTEMLTQAVIVFVDKTSLINLSFYMSWMDIGIKIACLLTFVSLGVFLLKKIADGTMKSIWIIPLTFCLSEVGNFLMDLYLSKYYMSMFGELHVNFSYVFLAITGLGIILSILMIMKNRKLNVLFA